MFALSVFAVMTHLINAATTQNAPIISIVPTGDPGATSITILPTVAVGATFSVDVRIDDYSGVNIGGTNNGINGASYVVTWNIASLEFVSYTDVVTWLPSQFNVDITADTANGELTIGQSAFGSSAEDTADNSAGSVSATIEFQVVSNTVGTTIGLEQQGTNVPYLTAPETVGGLTSGHAVPDVTTENVQYGQVSTPTVSISPTSATSDVGQYQLFTATPSGGSGTYTSYQWYVGGTAQSGQIASTFSFDPASAGSYSITATVTDSSAAISAQSTAASVMVSASPTVIIAPGGPLTLDVGVSQTFTATPSGGSGTITYQWYLGGSAVSDATASTYSFSESTAGSYSVTCKVTDSATTPVTSPASNTVSVTVNPTTTTPTPTPSTTPVPSPTPTPTPTATPTPTPSPTPSSTPTPTPTGPTHGPTGIISIQNGTTYATDDDVVLDGSSSTAGYDAQSVKSCPVSNYAWEVQYENGSVFGAYSGSGVAVVVGGVGWLQITLIVTAPDVNTSPNPQYTNTSLASVWINVESPQQLTKIDVFTNKGGIGPDAPSGPFGPQELVQLCAYVAYNGGFEANENVAFTVISPNDTVIAVRTALTNSTGYASVNYVTPNIGSSNFGIWTVVASVEVNQVIVTDKVTFEYNYLVNVIDNGITLPASAARGSTITISVSIQNLQNISLTSTLTITIYDQNDVPIYTSITNNINAADGATVKVTFTIPTYAFVGEATVYVNILTANPTSGGVPLCPETTANFQILS